MGESCRASACPQPAISEQGLCAEHFLAWFEERVNATVDAYAMIAPGERVLVAASGGKDSLTLLDILSRRFDCTAFTIDEGIAGYREHTLADLERFCRERDITLLVKTFERERGTRLDALATKHPCTTCGTWRRELMAEAAKGFDVIATGHNLDDEAQAVLMNITKHHPLRPQPVKRGGAGFTRKVKPLYFMPEADVRRYAYLKGFVSAFVECPNAALSHRRAIQRFLEGRERANPGTKERLVRGYLDWLTARSS